MMVKPVPNPRDSLFHWHHFMKIWKSFERKTLPQRDTFGTGFLPQLKYDMTLKKRLTLKTKSYAGTGNYINIR